MKMLNRLNPMMKWRARRLRCQMSQKLMLSNIRLTKSRMFENYSS